MTWQPQTQHIQKAEVKHIFPIAEAMLRAMLKAHGMTRKVEATIKDDKGIYGLAGLATKAPSGFVFVLTARNYIYGNIISVSRDIMQRALLQDRYLLVFIKKATALYLFDSQEAYRTATVSYRNGTHPYYDFNIGLGKNFTDWLRVFDLHLEEARQTKLFDHF